MILFIKHYFGGEEMVRKSSVQMRREAIKVLVELGACYYMKDLDIYHGRANRDGKKFHVLRLNNANNGTGNMNVSDLDGLYAGTYEIANEFAEERVWGTAVKEVHKIVGINEDDAIFNTSFKTTDLGIEDCKKFYNAMRVLTNFDVSHEIPINFKHKKLFETIIIPVLQETNAPLVNYYEEESVLKKIKERAKSVKYDILEQELEKIALDYIHARNTRYLLRRRPIQTIKGTLRKRQEDLVHKDVPMPFVEFTDGGYGEAYRISSSYLSAWLANNHIVGYKSVVHSGTLGKNIESYHLIDISQIMTERDYGEYLQKISYLERVADGKFSNIFNQEVEEFFRSANGEELIEFVGQDEACKQLFDKSAGIWEEWTVGQHTASVIDFFNQYYADSLPDNMHTIMKLAFLVHDIGKGATRLGENHKEASLRLADKLFDSLNIDNSSLREMIKFVIGEGQEYTTNLLLKNLEDKNIQLRKFDKACENVVRRVFKYGISRYEIDMLRNMCLILQFCDSGAYTYYAKIKEGNVYVTGGNECFTNSFILTNKGTPVLAKAKDFKLTRSSLGMSMPDTFGMYPPFVPGQYNVDNPLNVM